MSVATQNSEPLRSRSRRSTLRERRWLMWGWFPAAVLVVFATLVTLNLSGSSISLLADDSHRAGVVSGEARTIRSDEFLLRTPLAISSQRQGLPEKAWIGLSNTEQSAAAHGGPTSEWSTLLKPQDWGYVALGASRGLAWAWWWSFAMSAWGCFALFGLVTRRPLVAAGLATGATFVPYAAWWTAPAPALFLGYGAAIGACLIGAWIVARRRSALAFSLGGAFFTGCFVLALYPPWQVSLAFVIAALLLGLALDWRLAWSRIAWTSSVVAAGGVGLAGIWLVQHWDAIVAQTATYYPGHRQVSGGTAELSWFTTAPLNWWMTGKAGSTITGVSKAGVGANLSEVSSTWISLPLLAVIAICAVVVMARSLVVRRTRPDAVESAASPDPGRHSSATSMSGNTRGEKPRWTVALLLAVTGLFFIWAFIPIPSTVGKWLFLDRVQPSRIVYAIGFAQLLLIAVVGSSGWFRSGKRWLLLVLSAIAGAAVTVWTVRHLPWSASDVSLPLALLSGFVLAAILAWICYGRWMAAASVALACYAVLSWFPVNPVQHGIAPAVSNAVSTSLNKVAERSQNHRVAVFGNLRMVAQVRVAGFESVSGTTLYPDAELMSKLAPTQQSMWNNYAQYVWSPAAQGSSAVIEQVRGTLMTLHIDPCDPVLLKTVDPGWVVSETPLSGTCLAPASQVKNKKKVIAWIYEVR